MNKSHAVLFFSSHPAHGNQTPLAYKSKACAVFCPCTEMIHTGKQTSTLVIALSSLFVCDIHTSLGRISQVVETVRALVEQDYRVILVTGGALGMGCRSLDRQATRERRAALTAVGQAKLIRLYSDLFARVNQPVGQLILTQPDAFLSCVEELCSMKVVPICHAVKKRKQKNMPLQETDRPTFIELSMRRDSSCSSCRTDPCRYPDSNLCGGRARKSVAGHGGEPHDVVGSC